MKIAKTAMIVACVTMASLALSRPSHDKLELAAPLRIWKIRLAEKVKGWPLYQDGESICILKEDATTGLWKTAHLSLADQRYLETEPPPVRRTFDPEALRVALMGDIEELTGRLAAMEAAQKTTVSRVTTRTLVKVEDPRISEDSDKADHPGQKKGRPGDHPRPRPPVDRDVRTPPDTNRVHGITAPDTNRVYGVAGQDTNRVHGVSGQDTNRVHGVTVEDPNSVTVTIGVAAATEETGPSPDQIRDVRAALAERKAKLAALIGAYRLKDEPKKTTD